MDEVAEIYDFAPCGFFQTSANEVIQQTNSTFLSWLGYTHEEVLKKKKWTDFLTMGSKIYHHTHFTPLLNMQGDVEEINFEMRKKNGEKLSVLVNAHLIRKENDSVEVVYYSVYRFTQRKQYEIELLKAKQQIKAQNEELYASKEELKQNIEELQTTKELVSNAFAELDAQFRAIGTTLGYVEISTDRKVERVNQLFADWLGYEVDELQGHQHVDFIPNTEEDQEKYIQLWKTLDEGNTYTDIFKRKAKDGQEIWLYGAYCPVKNKDGEVIKIIKVASNYTQQKEVEKELQRLSLVANKTDNIVIITDKNGITEWVNEGFTKTTEYSFDEAIGKKPSQLLQGEGTNPLHIEAVRKGLNSQKQFIQEIYNYSKTGRGYWLELNITPIFDKKNELVSFIAVQTNITERKEHIEKIQKQTERFDLAVSGANDGVWDWDIANDKMYFSPRWKSMLGYEEHEIESNYPAFEAILHEEDRERILERINKYIAGDIPTYEDEIRMKAKDGSWKWILTKGGILRNEEGKPIRMAGSHSDITDRKKAEEELRYINNELAKQKEEVEKSLLELQTTQQQLIQSEKMASLGQLVASIAHEINTPLGAIRSSAFSIEGILMKILPTLPHFLKKLDDTTFINFSEFIVQSSQKSDTLSSREKRVIRRKLLEELENIELRESLNLEYYLDLIVDMNMYDESQLYLPLLQGENVQEVFYTAYQISSILRSNQTVKIATDRAAKIVFALKNYVHQDQTGEKSTVNINESIETTLTLYHNQIKHGIDVTTEWGEIPKFMGYPDELIQVWTNIVHNAIQAMKNKGNLFIQTRVENNNVLVSIQDNGGGISKEVQNRIFDAFFTTKSAGEGSGLGLDITRKIIEKHNGKIWFDSLEGKGTTFFIELPIENIPS